VKPWPKSRTRCGPGWRSNAEQIEAGQLLLLAAKKERVSNAVRLLLLALLFLTGQLELCASIPKAYGHQELCASIPKTRVGNFFPLAASPRPEVALQVPELRLDNPLLYGESVSGRLFGFVDGPNLYAYVRQNPWSKFDPEGLSAAGWFADSFLNADTVKGGVELVRGADYATAAGWEEAGVGVVGTVAGTADAAFTVATCGLKGLVEGAIKGGIKALVKGAAEGEAKALVKVAVEDVAKTEAKQLGGKTAKQVVEEGEKTVAKETEEAASKEISKPPKGKGSVPPNQRDPKRVFSKNEKADALKERGGTCEQCGEKLDVDDAKGHHIERHADGGPTTKDNLANVCEDCHKELHR